jgi:hypothetical protein
MPKTQRNTVLADEKRGALSGKVAVAIQRFQIVAPGLMVSGSHIK